MAGPRRARADSRGWCHIGRLGVVVVRKNGLRSIAFQLERAAGSDGHKAVAAAFKKADGIRRQLGCFWDRLICRRPGAGGNGDAPG